MADKVLIIDDDIDTLKLVGMMLQREGYRILVAASGVQGLKVAESELPDIILLDVMMPQMDGNEVARRLRANPETAGVPILMFTARVQIEDRVAGLESGADAYLTKPAHPNEVQAQVRSLITRAREAPRRSTSPAEMRAYSVGVLSARGGSGVTGVALNLAAALETMTQGEVVLAELRPGLGSLALDLDIIPPRNLSALLSLPPGDITRPRIAEALVTHACGLKLLLSSFQPRDITLVENTAQFQTLAQRLTYMAQFVVYDLGAGLTTFAQKIATGFCDELLIVIEPTSSAVIHARALVENLVELGVDQEHLACISNDRGGLNEALTPAQVEELLGRPLTTAIEPASELFAEALRSHNIPVLMKAGDTTRQQYLSLAERVFHRAPAPR